MTWPTIVDRLEKKIARLEAELTHSEARATRYKARAAGQISELMNQHNELVADLKFALHMAALWKRAAKEQWRFKQLVNEYVQALKADEEG